MSNLIVISEINTNLNHKLGLHHLYNIIKDEIDFLYEFKNTKDYKNIKGKSQLLIEKRIIKLTEVCDSIQTLEKFNEIDFKSLYINISSSIVKEGFNISTNLKKLILLKNETKNSFGNIGIINDGSYSYKFTDIKQTIKADTFNKLLEKTIDYIITNRVYIKTTGKKLYYLK